VKEANPAVEPRLQGAWQSWLASLATDADAATAAAHLYAELPPAAKDAWLDALAEDCPALPVPQAAVYGPLLTVEPDPARRQRIHRQAQLTLSPLTIRRALLGAGPGGVRLAVLVLPLYLSFVRLLVCRFVRARGFDWVEQDPIVHEQDIPKTGSVIDGVTLRDAAVDAVIDELAHAVLAQRRHGGELPKLLQDYADVFSPRLGG